MRDEVFHAHERIITRPTQTGQVDVVKPTSATCRTRTTDGKPLQSLLRRLVPVAGGVPRKSVGALSFRRAVVRAMVRAHSGDARPELKLQG